MAMRDPWIEQRAAAMNGGGRNFSQMHFVRQGVVTEEMEYVAKCEKLTPELVRSKIARGRAIIHQRDLEPMGVAFFYCGSLAKV